MQWTTWLFVSYDNAHICYVLLCWLLKKLAWCLQVNPNPGMQQETLSHSPLHCSLQQCLLSLTALAWFVARSWGMWICILCVWGHDSTMIWMSVLETMHRLVQTKACPWRCGIRMAMGNWHQGAMRKTCACSTSDPKFTWLLTRGSLESTMHKHVQHPSWMSMHTCCCQHEDQTCWCPWKRSRGNQSLKFWT